MKPQTEAIVHLVHVNTLHIKNLERKIYHFRTEITKIKLENEKLNLQIQPKLFNDGEHLPENPTP